MKPIKISVLLPLLSILFITGHQTSRNSSDPGWLEQYYLMKRNEQGVIPHGITRAVAEERMNNDLLQSASNLLNVQLLGPYNRGGRTRVLLIDRADTNHLLAGGASGGLWASYNRGQTWTPLNDQAPVLSVTCIVQDPFNPSVIYYGTGESNTTTALQSKATPGDGIFKSTDGGKTFAQIPSTTSRPFDFIRTMQMSLTTPEVMYVGTADSGLYKSVNGGASFTRVYSNSTYDVEDIEVFRDGRVMIAVKAIGILVSTTGDAGTFTKLSGGLPTSGFWDLCTAYCDSFPNVIYAQFSNSNTNALIGVWKSTDGGSNWTAMANPENQRAYSFPWYALALAVKPDNPDFVLSGDVYMVYSTNGGVTWNDTRLSHGDQHVVCFNPKNINSFYVGNDGGVYRYNTGSITSTYEDLNKGYTVTQFYAGAYFPTGVNMFGGTQDNSTLQSNNGDSLFLRIDPYNGDGSYCAVNQQNPNVAYLSWQYGRIRKSTNAQSGSPSYSSVMNELDADNSGGVDDGVWFNNPFEMNMLDGNQVYFTTYKRVWRTVNGAANWVPLTNILNGDGNSPYAIGVSRAVNPTVYIGGQNLKFYRMDNAATATAGSEVNLRSSAPSSIQSSFVGNITVHPSNESTIYVALSSYSTQPRIWKVTNAKSSPVWTSLQGDLPVNVPVNWIEVDPQNPDSFFIAGTEFGLYTTINGGKNWNYESQLPNVYVFQLRLRHSDRKLFIYTHGRGVWMADLPSLNTGIVNPTKSFAAQLYPNPAENFIHIEAPKNSLIHIYNSEGKLMLTSRCLSSVETINLQKFPAGTYLADIFFEGKKQTIQFLKN